MLKALDQPCSFRFANETPLGPARNEIARRARTDNCGPLPIDVDPVDLQEADRTMESTVSLAVHGVPLRSGLRVLLEPVGLDDWRRGGLIEVLSQVTDDSDADRPEPAYEDPRRMTGHGVTSLAAAGPGGLLAHGMIRHAGSAAGFGKVRFRPAHVLGFRFGESPRQAAWQKAIHGERCAGRPRRGGWRSDSIRSGLPRPFTVRSCRPDRQFSGFL